MGNKDSLYDRKATLYSIRSGTMPQRIFWRPRRTRWTVETWHK